MSTSYPLAGLEESGHFRLVDLLPGVDDTPLQCTLSEHILIDAPKYEGLSYAWGGIYATANSVMTLNGQPFPITQELQSALRRLRRPDQVRTLWVDWICINQANLTERNAQVALMRDIYRRAERVVAWIGEESDDSDRAMSFLLEMAMARKWDLRHHWINGVRLGSDTSSECGDGKRPEPADDGDSESIGEEAESSGSSNGGDDPEMGCGHHVEEAPLPDSEGEPPADETCFWGNEVEVDALGSPPAADELPSRDAEPVAQREDDEGGEDRVNLERSEVEEIYAKMQRAYEERQREYDHWWNEYKQREGHIVTGFPVLYDTPHYEFFQDSRQADWEALDALLARPWWSRTWVVQEVWHSAETMLQCGARTLKWKTFQKAMDYEEGWDDMGMLIKKTSRWESWNILKRRYGLAIHIAKKRLLGSQLSDLLWNMWDREATDPRDKVFAVLGLAGGDGGGFPPVDYSKPVEHVYRETAASIIKGEKSLDILLAASGSNTRNGLPSWVPDWRREANDLRPALFINGALMRILCYYSGSCDVAYFHGHGYWASGKSDPVVRFDNSWTTLYARGILFDTVAEVSPEPGDGKSAQDIIEAAQATLKRFITSARHKDSPPDIPLPEIRELTTVLRAGTFVGAGSLGTESQVVENIMEKRRFFVTGKGHLCIGPSDTQLGDVVAILAGCNFPMVIRSRGGSRHVLVGEAYVHKHMTGEALGDSTKVTDWLEITIC